MSSGLVMKQPAVLGPTASFNASVSGSPVSGSGYRVITLYPAVAGVAASHGWLKIVVMISSLWASPLSAWYFLIINALL